MTKSRKKTRDASLAPLAKIVLAAFANGRAQDRVTIICECFGNPIGIGARLYAAQKLVADEALETLLALGYLQVDGAGWYRSTIHCQLEASK